jgi:hypothetical protein
VIRDELSLDQYPVRMTLRVRVLGAV